MPVLSQTNLLHDLLLACVQRAALGKRAIELYGNPKNWSAADLSAIGSVAKSVGRSALAQLNASAVFDSLSNLSTVSFGRQNVSRLNSMRGNTSFYSQCVNLFFPSRSQGRVLLNHIKSAAKSNWGQVIIVAAGQFQRMLLFDYGLYMTNISYF